MTLLILKKIIFSPTSCNHWRQMLPSNVLLTNYFKHMHSNVQVYLDIAVCASILMYVDFQYDCVNFNNVHAFSVNMHTFQCYFYPAQSLRRHWSAWVQAASLQPYFWWGASVDDVRVHKKYEWWIRMVICDKRTKKATVTKVVRGQSCISVHITLTVSVCKQRMSRILNWNKSK